MSTSSVCQGLQSCLEPGVAESRVLRLKLSLPNPNLYSVTPKPTTANDGLSFLQALAGPRSAAAEAESVYVHPMVKRSASTLSAKSLDMCTESLGSETGGGDEMDMLSGEAKSHCQARPWREVRALKRGGQGRSFPPPLTSVSSSVGLKVTPHREDGRLVLTAIASPPPNSCFQADRTGGRLRLRLVSFETNEDVDDVAGEEISDGDCSEEEEVEEDEEETEEALCGEGMDDKIESSGVKMVNGKLRRCKEEEVCGNGKTVIWDQPRLVAT